VCFCVQTEIEKWLRRGCVEILWCVPLFNFYMVPDDGLTFNENNVPVYLPLNTQLCLMEEYWFFICITTERNKSPTSQTQQ
jgi:hypothetical protein